MKIHNLIKILFASILISITGACASPTNEALGEPEDQNPAMENYSTPERTFIIHNTGNSPLTISEIAIEFEDGYEDFFLYEPPDFPWEPIAPGSNAEFTVLFEALWPDGDKNGTVGVESDDPDNPVFNFKLTGESFSLTEV